MWGIDTYGSVFKKYKETGIFDKNEIYPYITEGIGEDFLPKNVDFSVIDHFEKVTDKDAAIMTRRLAREEGIFAGNSAGAAMAGLLQLADHFTRDDMVVVIFHDHGSRYLAKMYNDEWMRAKGFLEVTGMTARDLVALGVSGELYAVEAAQPVEEAVRVMSEHDFSQISVTRNGRVVGSLNETHLYKEFIRDPHLKHKPVEEIMQPAFPFVDISTPVELLSTMITPENPAVLVRDFKTEKTFIITRSDIIRVMLVQSPVQRPLGTIAGIRYRYALRNNVGSGPSPLPRSKPQLHQGPASASPPPCTIATFASSGSAPASRASAPGCRASPRTGWCSR